MLSTTIPAYLYQEYADDEDLQAFVAAYNQATQTLVTWFATVNLPYYPGLTGDLLDWVVEGLYGLPRTSLATAATAALGMLNTQVLNSEVLNGYIPSSQTFYALNDDVFKRILTWDFYKGDGKRFSMPWLKRRVMRFLLGVNGTDPQPWLPGFVIGAETTSAIGAQVSDNVVTVTINQTLLSTQAQVAPGVLQLFQAAFEGIGVLDLPVQYTYVCNIVTALTATISPASVTSTGTAFTQTTGIETVRAVAGSGEFSYAWSWASGGTGIVINSPSSAATNFTATGMTWGETLTGLARCTVTDIVTSDTATVTCMVTINCVSPPDLYTGASLAILAGSGVPLIVG